jgi:hypothetical protein
VQNRYHLVIILVFFTQKSLGKNERRDFHFSS